MNQKSLYERLGGYEGVVAIVSEFMPRIRNDPQLGRFYRHRGEDGIAREQQLLVDFISSNAGGRMYYRGRDMASAHRSMKINESDWSALLGHCAATMEAVRAGPQECDEVVAFLASFKNEIVEA